jgi:hypothetical protein
MPDLRPAGCGQAVGEWAAGLWRGAGTKAGYFFTLGKSAGFSPALGRIFTSAFHNTRPHSTDVNMLNTLNTQVPITTTPKYINLEFIKALDFITMKLNWWAKGSF